MVDRLGTFHHSLAVFQYPARPFGHMPACDQQADPAGNGIARRAGHDRQLVALAAAAAVLALGVLDGMLVAVLLSIAALLGRLARPHVARLGRVADSHDFVDVARHPEARAPDGVIILRPLQPLFFANAEAVTAQLAGCLPDQAGGTRLVISLEESPDLDSTAAEALVELDSLLRQRGVEVRYARVHDRARDVLAAAGLEAIDSRIHFSVDDAVSAILSPLRSEEDETSR